MCIVPYMTTSDPVMFSISIDEYRSAISAEGARYAAARRRLELVSEVLRLRVVGAVNAGLSQNEAAKLSGVTRQTVRVWLGK